MVINRIPDSALLVRQPLVVMIEPMGDRFLATSTLSNVYEIGETRAETLHSYLDALVEHFYWLSEKEAILAPTVKQELMALRRYLQMPS